MPDKGDSCSHAAFYIRQGLGGGTPLNSNSKPDTGPVSADSAKPVPSAIVLVGGIERGSLFCVPSPDIAYSCMSPGLSFLF